MGENEVLEVPSPTPITVDISPIVDQLEKIEAKQGEIIEQNKKLIEHFVPTPEQIKEQKIQEQKELDQVKKEEENLQKEKEKIQENIQLVIDSYTTQLNDIKSELIKLNKTNVDSLGVSTVSSTSSYLLLFGVVAIALCYGIYKCFIKPFIY